MTTAVWFPCSPLPSACADRALPLSVRSSPDLNELLRFSSQECCDPVQILTDSELPSLPQVPSGSFCLPDVCCRKHWSSSSVGKGMEAKLGFLAGSSKHRLAVT